MSFHLATATARAKRIVARFDAQAPPFLQRVRGARREPESFRGAGMSAIAPPGALRADKVSFMASAIAPSCSPETIHRECSAASLLLVARVDAQGPEGAHAAVRLDRGREPRHARRA